MKKTEEIFFIPWESAGTDISRVSLSYESALIVAVKGVNWLLKMIDAHIHLDKYEHDEIQQKIDDHLMIDRMISVSNDLESCKRNLKLVREYPKVKAALGYHPEQALPSEESFIELLIWMGNHLSEMIAIGEVGLPYYFLIL